jgi:hypothetical protein
VEGLLRLLKPDGGEVVLGAEELAVADMLGIPVKKEKSKIRVISKPNIKIKKEPLEGASEVEVEGASQGKDVKNIHQEIDKLFARMNALENNPKPQSSIAENEGIEECEDHAEAEPEDAGEDPLEQSVEREETVEASTGPAWQEDWARVTSQVLTRTQARAEAGSQGDDNEPSGNQEKFMKKLVVELKDVAKTEPKNRGIISKLVEIKSEKKAETRYMCNKCDYVCSGAAVKKLIRRHVCIKHYSDDFNGAMEEHFKEKTCTLLECGMTLGSTEAMKSHLIFKHKYFDGRITSDVNQILGNPIESESEEMLNRGRKRKGSLSSISQNLPKEKTYKLNDDEVKHLLFTDSSEDES